MKTGVTTQTSNVQLALRYIELVRNRDIVRQRGLMLIYGMPGLGKTWFSESFAFQNQFIFTRLYRSMKNKDFVHSMLAKLNEYNGTTGTMSRRHTTFELFDELKRVINEECATPPVILIDEIDYAIKCSAIIDTIRDLADSTAGTFICIGMHEVYGKLVQVSPYFFDRCSYVLEFKPLSEKDIANACRQIAETNIDNTNIKLIANRCDGNFRKLIKLINHAEVLGDNEKLYNVLRS
jgi:replication-associated recombination protein RarA